MKSPILSGQQSFIICIKNPDPFKKTGIKVPMHREAATGFYPDHQRRRSRVVSALMPASQFIFL